MNRPLFRKEAMDQLASPDQLDQMIAVTSTRGWITLLAVGIFLATALLWGIFGSVPTRVAGEGIILFKQGVFSVSAEYPGKVCSVMVQEGDMITSGQTVATIFSKEEESKISDLTAKLDILRKDYENTLKEDQETFRSFQELLDMQRKNVEIGLAQALSAFQSSQALLKNQRETAELLIKSQEIRLDWLKKRLQSREELYRDQLITLQTVHSTRQEMIDGENEIKRLEDEIENLNLQELVQKNRLDEKRRKAGNDVESLDVREKERRTALEEKARKARADIEQLEEELALEKEALSNHSNIVSEQPGQVVKVEVTSGTVVSPGDRIALLEIAEHSKAIRDGIYDALMYAPPAEGKKIKPGMEVQVIPATVKAEEYGVMLGRVVYVSDFPVSPHAMLNVLENAELVQIFLQNGPPFEVWVDLLPDAENRTGFKWSSRKEPPGKIYSGTLCAAEVVVRRQAPITLVIPLLREALFGAEGIGDE